MNTPIKPERQRRWANPSEFLKTRTSTPAAGDFEELTAESTLYAHYRRWAHKRDESAVSDTSFRKALGDRRVVPIEINERMFWPLVLKEIETSDPDEDEDERKAVVATVRGKVRVLRPIQFRKEVLEAGAVVEHLVATRLEEQHLERLSGNNAEGAMSWLVVLFNGRRRYIPGNYVERL